MLTVDIFGMDVYIDVVSHHDRFGIPKSKLSFYRNTTEPLAEYGLQSSARKSKHRALAVSAFYLHFYRVDILTVLKEPRNFMLHIMLQFNILLL